MTTFRFGPAAGKTLLLHRQPIYLRVVIDRGGKVDALDQLRDVPSLTESLYAYRIAERGGRVHVNMGPKGGGTYDMATYEFLGDQPADEVMRSQARWEEWTQAEYDRQTEADRNDPS